MPAPNRNAFLDIPSDSDHDDADNGYDSEEADRKSALRSRKRRRIDNGEDESQDDLGSADSMDEGSEDEDEDEDAAITAARARLANRKAPSSGPADGDGDAVDNDLDHEDGDEDYQERAETRQQSQKKLTRLKTSKTSKKADLSKTGILYISRIPPFMKPSTLRTLLAPHAPKHGLNRLFLTPEPPSAHKARVKSGGNKKKSFTDGWIEFNSKREAKTAHAALNARPIGGKKGGWYRDDVWNMRYLRGFKWEDLMAQMRGEKVEREGRVRAEIASQAREDRAFVEGVERGRALRGIQETRRRRAEREGMVDEVKGDSTKGFRQNVVRDKRAADGKEKKTQTQMERVIGGIF